MTVNGWIQIALFCLAILVCVKPLGGYMARVFAGERTFLSPLLSPVERLIYWLGGVRPDEEQHWTGYTIAMLAFSLAGFLSLYALQRFQAVLPFNPQGLGAVGPDLAFGTSVSFITNTNWQSYGGETTMSHFTQMAGLTVQNFLSAATGIALAVAVTRAFVRSEAKTLGNFWVDMVRSTLYVLLPLAMWLANRSAPLVLGLAALCFAAAAVARFGWAAWLSRLRGVLGVAVGLSRCGFLAWSLLTVAGSHRPIQSLAMWGEFALPLTSGVVIVASGCFRPERLVPGQSSGAGVT